MWFRSRHNNRRSARGHVLEVRLRTRELRAARLRLAAASLALAFATLVGLYVLWRTGAWAMDRLMFSNPAFAVRRLHIRTDGVLPLTALQQWAGIRRTDNLLALDLERVRRDLELVPAIRSASLHRVLPDTLRIEITERVPVAEVQVPQLLPGGGFSLVRYHLDADGYVMQFSTGAHPQLAQLVAREHLPQLVGIDASQLRAGRTTDARMVRAALRLLAAFEESAMYGLVDVRSIDVAQPDTIELSTSQESRITFGADRLEHQLACWRQAYDYAALRGCAIASLDLSVGDRSPLVLAQAGPVSPEAPAPRRTPRPRRRHA